MPSVSCDLFQWPPPYCFKYSPRAKRLRLKIDPIEGLCLICPNNISKKEAIYFLNANQRWIKKNWNLIARANQPFEWPEKIYFPFCDHQWCFKFDFLSKATVIYSKLDSVISCCMREPEPALFRHMFKRWLIRTAYPLFLMDLEQLSRRLGLSFNKLCVRCQKTCWGSCSHEGNISLNAKLLFYPKKVVQYVMIHELCHTVYMDHSQSFWQMVSSYDSDYKAHIKCLKDLSFLPVFL